MDSSQLHYLRIVNKYVGGPLKAQAGDNATLRTLNAISGVLLRVIVNAENRPKRLEQLKSSAQEWRALLKGRLPPGSDARRQLDELDKLADSGVVTDPVEIEALIAQIAGYLGKQKDEESRQLVREIVEQDWKNSQYIENECEALGKDLALKSGDPTRPGLTAEEQRRLSVFLQERCGESDRLEIGSVKVVPGGLSKRTMFVELKNNSVLSNQIVLRQDLADSPLGSTVVTEYPLLQVLYEEGVKVPKPLALDARGDISGAPLLAVSRAAGAIIGDGINLFEKDGRRGCAIALAREMAKYHQIPLHRLPDSLPGKNGSNLELMRADLAGLRQKWQDCKMSSIVIETAFSWLLDHLESAGEERSLTHGDLRLHNVLVEGEEVVAILDWELATVNSRAFDLAYAYHDVTQLVTWQQFLNAYTEAGGIVPPKATLDFYLIRTELFIAVNMSKIEAAVLAGAFDNIHGVYGSICFTQYARYLLAEHLRAVLSDKPL